MTVIIGILRIRIRIRYSVLATLGGCLAGTHALLCPKKHIYDAHFLESLRKLTNTVGSEPVSNYNEFMCALILMVYNVYSLK